MLKIAGLILLLFTLGNLSAQEICNNGIDDDGDGLVDLLDEECSCIVKRDIIPNPSFEIWMSCVSSNIYGHNNVLNWEVSSGNFYVYSLCHPNTIGAPTLIPTVPDGMNFIHFHISNGNTLSNQIQYGAMAASVCLTDSLFANRTYILKIKGNHYHSQGYQSMPTPITIELFGRPTCSPNVTPTNQY
ncbi:hypothetical protein DNU06_11685 [Putridiphycobacter roseus]|uniref:Uncharacterized protein n=1 Tax=Putridiphycobacter roseus TaxID=2219161 RepID=A0A2W1NQI0_9FLAO|nr:hypothetical protein [Putridiphycobacter roseus]PZE16908.1 hypothetical protein DNU06_11685 [Putridiphycobacter roseus]